MAAMISQKALTAERDAEEREAEQAILEEEMRRRRERVRAWQLEKAARLVAESNEKSQLPHSSGSLESGERQSTLENGADDSANGDPTGNLETEQNNHDRHHWTLEDDDEDEADADETLEDIGLEKNDLPPLLGPITPQSEQEEMPSPFAAVPLARLAVPSGAHHHTPIPVMDASPDTAIRKPASSRFNRLSGTSEPTITLPTAPVLTESAPEIDPLDMFMASLYDSGDVTEQNSQAAGTPKSTAASAITVNPFGSNFITLDQIMGRSLGGGGGTGAEDPENDTKSVQEWESEIAFSPAPSSQQQLDSLSEIDLEKEERERREFLEALKAANVSRELDEELSETQVKEEVSTKSTEEFGRVFAGEGDLIDESEVEAKKKSALEILEDAKRAKELKPLDHSTVEYMPFRKNLYIVPRALARLAPEEVSVIRATLQIKVRGKGCPVPVENWDQCGLSERILSIIHKHNFEAPFSIQKQAIPAIMCGRDIIAVAKTGSGKTLAFLLPLFRHILDQPPLRDSEGPIGLIMAPARELAFQITNEAKKFTKALGIRVACVYGGAAVADQIAELKRGADIVVCTPGRMIDILCMQAGKLVSFRRVTFVVMVSLSLSISPSLTSPPPPHRTKRIGCSTWGSSLRSG
jgi:hypothetical protein